MDENESSTGIDGLRARLRRRFDLAWPPRERKLFVVLACVAGLLIGATRAFIAFGDRGAHPRSSSPASSGSSAARPAPSSPSSSSATVERAR